MSEVWYIHTCMYAQYMYFHRTIHTCTWYLMTHEVQNNVFMLGEVVQGISKYTHVCTYMYLHRTIVYTPIDQPIYYT